MSVVRRFRFWQVLLTFLIGPLGVGVIGNVFVCFALGFVLTDGLSGVLGAMQSFPVVAVSLVVTALGFAGGPLGLVLLTKQPLAETLGFARRPHPAALVAAPIGILALGPTSDVLVELAKRVAPWASFGALEEIERIVAGQPVLVLLPFLALCPGVGEEILFRGFLQRWVGKGALAIVVSGLAFALVHLDPHHVVGVIPLGLYLAWVADRTDSTWTTIVAHVTNNAMAVVATKLVGSATAGAHATPPMMVAGWLVCAACMALIARVSRERPAAPVEETFA